MRDPTQPGLWIEGPEGVFSTEARDLLGDRLEIKDATFVIKPLAGEELRVYHTGHELPSPVIAMVGLFVLRVSVDPSRHDVIELLPSTNYNPETGREIVPVPTPDQLGCHADRHFGGSGNILPDRKLTTNY